MNFDSFADIINLAKLKEEGSYATYVVCADKSKNALTKNLFLRLAEEEKNHKQLLDTLSPGNIERMDERLVNTIKNSDYLVDIGFDKDMSLQDAIIYAIKREAHAIEFYEKLIEVVADENSKKLLNHLKNEETGHKERLEDAYEDSTYQFS